MSLSLNVHIGFTTADEKDRRAARMIVTDHNSKLPEGAAKLSLSNDAELFDSYGKVIADHLLTEMHTSYIKQSTEELATLRHEVISNMSPQQLASVDSLVLPDIYTAVYNNSDPGVKRAHRKVLTHLVGDIEATIVGAGTGDGDESFDLYIGRELLVHVDGLSSVPTVHRFTRSSLKQGLSISYICGGQGREHESYSLTLRNV